MPGKTKIIQSSIQTRNSNELSRLLAQAIFLAESSRAGSGALPAVVKAINSELNQI